MNDGAHNERHALAIYLPDLSGGNQPIKCIGFGLGKVPPFPFLERDRVTFGPILEAIRKPRLIGWIAAIAASHCSLELIQPGRKAHVTSLN
jgi:hypothetical protein